MTWVKELARRMSNGLYRETPEPLMFDKNRVCINGQHRLNAVIVCGLPQTFHVHFGLDPSLFDVIDGGKKRTAGDIFSMRGVADCNVTAAIARQLNRYHYLQGDELLLKTPYETFDYYLSIGTEPMAGARTLYHKAHSNGLPYYSLVAGVYLAARSIDRSEADEFFTRITEGANLGVRSIEKKLRDHLLRYGKDQAPHKTRADVVRAWNAKRMKQRTFSTDPVGDGHPRLV